MLHLARLAGVFSALALVACGGGGSTTPAADGGGSAPLDGGSADGGAVSTTMIRTAQGGTVISADGILKVEIPPNAIAADTTFSVAVVPRAQWPSDVDAANVVGEIYRVEPGGTTFNPPATVRWTHATVPAGLVDATTGDREGLIALAGEPGAFELLLQSRSRYTAEGGLEVSGALAHLSLVVIERNGMTQRVLPPQSPQSVHSTFRFPITLTRRRTSLRCQGRDASATFAAYSENRAVVRPEPFPGGSSGDVERSADVTFSATGVSEPVPPPRFTCVEAGSAIIAVWSGGCGASESVALRIGCEAKDDAILLAANHMVDRTEAGLTERAGTPGVVANVISAHNDVFASFTALDATTRVYQGVSVFRSNAGPATLTLQAVHPPAVAGNPETVIQTGTATYDGTRYNITGLTSGANLYDAPGAFLRVTGTPMGASAPVVETLSAPMRRSEVGAVSALFGPLAGLATEFRPPNGTWDYVYIYVTATGGSGDSGIIRLVPRESIPLVGATRPLAILNASAIAALSTRGLIADRVYVGLLSQKINTTFFPSQAAMPIQAGWTFQLAASSLGATAVPDGGVVADGGTAPADGGTAPTDGGTTPADGGATGGAVVRTCAELPASFPDADPPNVHPVIVAICIGASVCKVTNDPYGEGAPTQCNDNNQQRAAYISSDANGLVFVGQGAGWRIAWQSANPLRLATDESMIVERESDRARWRIDFRVAADRTATVTSVASFTGPLPPFGAAYDCAALPRSFTAAESSGVYARVCLDPAGGLCSVHGHIEATPENEPCATTYALSAGYSEVVPGPYLQAGWPGSSDFEIESSSHGTVESALTVTGFPADTDITVVLRQMVSVGTARYQIVLRYITSGFAVQSVTRL